MENHQFDTMTEQMKKMMEPAARLNTALLEHMGKLAEFQMKSARTYGDMTLENIKGASAVKDLESLKGYASGQADFVGNLGSRIMEDFRTLGQLGAELKEDVEKAFSESSGQEEESAKEGTDKEISDKEA
ncbi:phasin family protein [Hahella sp. CCB-MM4]|uniref:phasin family protein n=1 Tax=Hahella sp. (strain CCB-MM4) TaxID=1926491 RepID=UPI000B9A8C95|nr:phasin family protein [Hahella sp. CCB-MM4]OZG74880.1 phasin family protein [Hahella sp. CCB-MM4]